MILRFVGGLATRLSDPSPVLPSNLVSSSLAKSTARFGKLTMKPTKKLSPTSKFRCRRWSLQSNNNSSHPAHHHLPADPSARAERRSTTRIRRILSTLPTGLRLTTKKRRGLARSRHGHALKPAQLAVSAKARSAEASRLSEKQRLASAPRAANTHLSEIRSALLVRAHQQQSSQI